MKTAKHQLRSEMKAVRNALQDSEIAIRSDSIQRQLLDLDVIKSAEALFVYVSFRSEVQTHRLIDKLMAMGKTVTVPYVVDAETMEAARFASWKEMTPDAFGVLTPELALIDEAAIDVCIAPGLAFSPHGDRLGYGKGHYDRFLARRRPAVTIGLAFECQIVDALPVDSFDRRMDRVVTEQRLIPR